jgi:hypothetical protein
MDDLACYLLGERWRAISGRIAILWLLDALFSGLADRMNN